MKALVNLKMFSGLIFLIFFVISLKAFFLFLLAIFAFDYILTFSTNLKKFMPSCSLITLPKIFPKYLMSSLSDFVGIFHNTNHALS